MTTKTEPVAQPVKKGHLHPELRAASRMLSILSEFPDMAQRRILGNVVSIVANSCAIAMPDGKLPPGTSDPRD